MAIQAILTTSTWTFPTEATRPTTTRTSCMQKQIHNATSSQDGQTHRFCGKFGQIVHCRSERSCTCCQMRCSCSFMELTLGMHLNSASKLTTKAVYCDRGLTKHTDLMNSKFLDSWKIVKISAGGGFVVHWIRDCIKTLQTFVIAKSQDTFDIFCNIISGWTCKKQLETQHEQQRYKQATGRWKKTSTHHKSLAAKAKWFFQWLVLRRKTSVKIFNKQKTTLSSFENFQRDSQIPPLFKRKKKHFQQPAKLSLLHARLSTGTLRTNYDFGGQAFWHKVSQQTHKATRTNTQTKTKEHIDLSLTKNSSTFTCCTNHGWNCKTSFHHSACRACFEASL